MSSPRPPKSPARITTPKARAKAQPLPPRARAANRQPLISPAAAPLRPPAAQPAHEELLHFFHESPDLLCIAGFDGRFKRLNPAWQPALGWTLAELMARPFLDFVLPDDHPATLTEMAKLSAGANTISFENRYQCKDGSHTWLQWTASPLPGRQEIYAIARNVTRQKELEEEILGVLDRERARLGRELRDGLCQELATIAAGSATLARKLAPDSAADSAAAREIGKLVRQSIQHARNMARALDPLHLREIGLTSALADFCLNTEATFKISCRLRCEDRPPALEASREAHLYRIAEEAVSNAITHGRAQRITVTLAFKNGRGTLLIEDDGLGVGDKPAQRDGRGLQTMTERARLIGASIATNRRSPCGTVVGCAFPATSSLWW